MPFVGTSRASNEEVDWAVVWLPEADAADLVTESYVNLIPTAQGGTHVNGFRTGLTEAIREFCEFRNLLPRGVKLAPEDVWSRCSYVLSLRMTEPQFTGQTKDRLSSREASAFVSGVAQDAFSIWLNNNVADAERIAQVAIYLGDDAPPPGEESRAQEADQRAGAAGQARRLHVDQISIARSSSWSKAILPAARPSRRATASTRPSCRCAARS